MSVIRRDLFTGDWIIFAANRKERPYDFVKKSEPMEKDYSDCPFCLGNEYKTPNVLFQNGKDGNWNIRVFPNMYPAVTKEEEKAENEGFYESLPGNGLHEVLVDTPEHTGVIHNFTVKHIQAILSVLQERYEAIKAKKGIEYIQIFKNCGPEAGMSLMHSHWQIMGIPFLSNYQRRMLAVTKEYYTKNRTCLFCHMLEHEQKERKRIIEENNDFMVFVPFAPKLSYEVWIAPKRHVCCFGDIKKEELYSLAELLKHTLRRVNQIRKDMSYNICFMDKINHVLGEEYCHWYLKIYPRMGSFAGFEFATGSYINPVMPEQAAEFYRGIDFLK